MTMHTGAGHAADNEPALEPQRPIIDPHLHFWDILPAPGSLQAPQRFLLAEAADTIARSGHAISHTVFVECHAMYRADGPAEWRSLGETEFANGIAAMAASGGYGPCRLGHRIVGNVDLTLGERARAVLEAHVAAAGGRFRGVRMNTAWAASGLFGFPCEPAAETRLRDPRYRQGAAVLADMGLSLDIWCVHTQLADVAALADAVPDLLIVLDHVGTPESLGWWMGREAEARADWATRLRDLARRPNVVVKIGGMGMDIAGAIPAETGTMPSQMMANRWRPLVETCVEAFGPDRAMFESNYPPDRAAGSYGAIWNAFKRIAQGWAEDEKDALFRQTAARVYGIALDA